jgi:hypothetical protein
MTIKLIRMSSGEDVIATVIEEVEDAIKIRNAIVVVPTQNQQLGFAPWSPVMDPQEESLEVFKHFIVYVTKPAPQVVEQYIYFSTIVTPLEKKIIV